METEIKISSRRCETVVFTINGVQASESDFGQCRDLWPSRAEGCGHCSFVVKNPDSKVMEKYGINADEFNAIAKKLHESLSFGCCDLCSNPY